MPSSWRRLLAESSPPHAPPLLFRYQTDPKSYTVWLSDMIHCWTEKLDRRQIIRRAFDLDTSIDPSEDAGQFKALLNRIQDALDGGPRTTRTVRHVEDERIAVDLEIHLPGTLAPLKWSLSADIAPPREFAAQLLIPLLNQRLEDDATVSHLRQEVAHKDAIISKFMNLVQNDGISIGRIFPSTQHVRSGSNNMSRDTLGRSIRGMSEFDFTKWRNEKTGAEIAPNVDAALARIFPDEPKDVGTSRFPYDLDEWMSRLSRGAKTGTSHPADSPIVPGKDADLGGTQDSKSPYTKTPAAKSTIDDSTTDESDHDVRADDQAKEILSERRPASPQADMSSTRTQTSDASKVHEHDQSTKDDLDPAESPRKSVDMPFRRGRLGKIGGKKVGVADTNAETVNSDSSKDARHAAVDDTDHGANDRNRQAAHLVPVIDRAEQEQTIRDDTTRETSRERADRKREALKRELEAKSKSGPKKKRKF